MTATADLVALRLVADRYALAVDLGDGDLFADQFMPDGILISPRGGFAGRAALAGVPAMMRGLYDRTHHAVTGLVPRVEGDRATAYTGTLARHFYRAGDGVGYCYEMTVRYSDQFVRITDGWRLARRELHLLGDATWPAGRRHTQPNPVKEA
ncbi:nuclear transport factor 2 family protein [Pontitalea aquivivens]|uniref:nuclear transport factor 2 family protein n=1 Tax=Pontitalea aquivivens TaxID=3388663 RepID=UPI0039709610